MSAFEDAFTQSLVSSLNPMNGIISQYAGLSLAQKVKDLDQEKQSFVKELRKELAEAIASNEDQEVLDSLKRLIKKHSA